MINMLQVKRYCCEDASLIENYEQAVADKKETWSIHHRLEVQGQFRNSMRLLIKCGMYWNRPASELIFLTNSEHTKLHSKGNHYAEGKKPWLGRRHSEETRALLSEMAKNRPPVSEETRRKMSEAHKGRLHTEESKLKMSANSRSGCPDVRAKLAASKIGRRWFNNGKEQTCQYECPPGFVPGRIKKDPA